MNTLEYAFEKAYEKEIRKRFFEENDLLTKKEFFSLNDKMKRIYLSYFYRLSGYAFTFNDDEYAYFKEIEEDVRRWRMEARI